MTNANTKIPPHELDDVVRKLVLKRAVAINAALLARIATVADDLDAGRHLAALGGIDGIERQIETMRAFLLLLR